MALWTPDEAIAPATGAQERLIHCACKHANAKAYRQSCSTTLPVVPDTWGACSVCGSAACHSSLRPNTAATAHKSSWHYGLLWKLQHLPQETRKGLVTLHASTRRMIMLSVGRALAHVRTATNLSREDLSRENPYM